ncbi:MAG: FAD-dependent oxidoreductase [Rhodoferax sp.]|nr:FAD-dependent oxidoreductase [Rhodoferax sp.]
MHDDIRPTAPLIIIGAGLAGWTTVREFRKLDPATPVVLVTADSGDFYAKPTLSNAYAQKRLPAQLVTTPAAKMVETLNVTLHAHSRVVNLDTAGHALTMVQDGLTTTLPYRQLVLATGAQPVRIPVEGNAANTVLSVNTLDDYAAFHQALGVDASAAGPTAKGVAIMGAGLIGCEFANDLRLAGVTVAVVDPAPRPLAALLPAPAGEALQHALQAAGVQWHLGTTVARVDMRTEGKLLVTLASGDKLVADLVLSAVGLRADTALAQAAGLTCERGIVVDALLQTSAPDVYALGDSAQYASAANRTLPYVMPIMNAARALAATLAGTPTPLVFPIMPVSVKTPALPLVVAPPHPRHSGEWRAGDGDGIWQFLDGTGMQRGFVLAGAGTAKRMEQSRLTSAE